MRVDEAALEDDGGFHDYTIATALEKLIGSIENALRRVLTKDLPLRYGISSGSHLPATYTAHLHHRLPFRSETYSLSLHLPSSTPPLSQPSKSALSLSALEFLHTNRHAGQNKYCSLGDQPNKLQEWFHPGPIVVLSPDSYSGRILDEEEAHTLLSAAAAALSHLKLPWPVCIPVHDALRDAFRGVTQQVVSSSGSISGSEGGGSCIKNKSNATAPMRSSLDITKSMTSPARDTAGGSTNATSGTVVRLESDSIHSNRGLPIEFCTLSGQLTMFAARLRWHAPYAASLCSELATAAADAWERQSGGNIRGLLEEEIEDQNLAAAAEALALSSSPPSKTPPGQKMTCTNSKPDDFNSSSDSSCEEQLSVRWEMRCSYQLPLPGSNLTNVVVAAAASGWETSSTLSQVSRSATALADNDDDDDFELLIDTWDEDAVWRPWAAEDDPIESLEIDALWNIPLTTTSAIATAAQPSSLSSSSYFHSIGTRTSRSNSSLVAAAVAVEQGGTLGTSGYLNNDSTKIPRPLPPGSATTWRLAALRRDYQPDDGRRPLILLQSVDQRRQFLRLQSITELPIRLQASTTTTSSSTPLSFHPPSDALPGATSFSGMLNTLLDHTLSIIHATDAAHLTSDDWWLQQGNYVPPLVPSHIIQDAIRDIFQALSMPPTWPGTGTGLLSEQLNTLERFTERFTETTSPGEILGERTGKHTEIEIVGKGAPLNSLISRVSLHALRLGNPRAIAMLWTKFLRELRFAHWEANVPLPRMQLPSEQPTPGVSTTESIKKKSCDDDTVDVQYCIIHQNLQLLDLSIRSKMQNQTENQISKEADEDNDEDYTSATESSDALSTNPMLEGEKALHFLETLPPAAVYAELLAVGFASAVAVLSRSPAAKLPAVAAQVSRVKEVGSAWMNDHGVAVAGTGTINGAAAVDVVFREAATAAEDAETALIPQSASESNLSTASDITALDIDTEPLLHHQQQDQTDMYSINASISISPAVHDMIHSGLGTDGMKTLVQILACVEQTIAASQSILQKLGDYRSSFEEFAKRAANALIAKALEHGSSHYSSSSDRTDEMPSPYGAVIDLDPAEFALISSVATEHHQEIQQEGEQENEASSAAPWRPTPFWSEWCISISKASTPNPLHRLFVRRLPAELRVATVITSEMS